MNIRKIAHHITIAALFLIPFFPLIVANSCFFPFIVGKALYFRTLVEIAFASWVILAFLDARYRPKWNGITIGVTVFAVVALVADLLGVNPMRSLLSNFERMEGWITIVHLWAFYIMATSLLGSNDGSRVIWHRWFNTSLAVAFLTSLYGLGQLFGWFAIHQGASRVDSFLGNAAYMGVYMLFSVGIAAYMFFVAKKDSSTPRFLVWVYPILAILFSFMIFETQTRGTILGLVGGIMLSLFLYAIFAKNGSKKSRYVSAGVLGLIVVVLALFWFNRHQPFIANNPVLGRFSNISWNESSNQARQYIWPMAIKGAMERPIFGWGQENFNYIFNANYAPQIYNQEQWFDRAHNVFLDWLVASGLVGFVAYLALYVLFVVGLWKSSLDIKEKAVITGLLAGYFVHNLFVFDNLVSYALFFALLGFVSSLMPGKPIKWLGSNPMRTDAVEYIVAPIAIVALVAVVYVFGIRTLEANTRLITALRSCTSNADGTYPDPTLFENALAVNSYTANQEIREQLLSCSAGVVRSSQIPGPTRQAFYTLASKEIDSQIAASPKDARIYTLGGSFMLGVGQVNEAVLLLEKAHESSPAKQSIALELASAYLNSGQYDKAIEVLKKAYESETSNTEAKSMYALSMVIGGKEAEARTMFNNDPAVFDTVEMAGVYSFLKRYSDAIGVYTALIKNDPNNVDLLTRLAQTQYEAGMKSAAIATLGKIKETHPEYKSQVEDYIKQLQNK